MKRLRAQDNTVMKPEASLRGTFSPFHFKEMFGMRRIGDSDALETQREFARDGWKGKRCTAGSARASETES